MDRPQDPDRLTCAVVLPCRNEAATLGVVLDAIEQQTYLPDEIVLVDDRSTDGTADVARTWAMRRPQIRLTIIDGPGLGPAAAMNAGIARCQSDIIVRLDGHCRPRLDYVEHSIATLIDHEAGFVGGVWHIRPGASTTVGRAIAAVVSHPIGSGGVAYRSAEKVEGVRDVDTAPFGCFRRALWEQLGGYDETLSANEDYDFNVRIRRAGYRVLLNPAIQSIYWSRGTLRSLGRQYFRYGFWKMQMLSKTPGAIRLRQLPPALIVPWLLLTVAFAAVSQHPLAFGIAALYPLAVAAAGVQIARKELRLLMPVFAAIVVEHVSWSAGFWHGVMRVIQTRA